MQFDNLSYAIDEYNIPGYIIEGAYWSNGFIYHVRNEEFNLKTTCEINNETSNLPTNLLPTNSESPNTINIIKYPGHQIVYPGFKLNIPAGTIKLESLNVILGENGTGKTTFIRGLLDYAKTSAIVTYDPDILSKDGFFADFLEDDDASIVVLEDSDAFLSARTEGNTMMHRFLNVSNGLVTSKGKKMIFSTNLPSIRDIDSALIRPGRCFDIVTFEPLAVDQAQTLAKALGVELPVRPRGKEMQKYSIAEVFNEQTEQMNKSIQTRKVGFI